jgi:hypothetical protein
MIDTPPPVYPWPIGVGPRYQPAAASSTAATGQPVGRMRCGRTGRQFVVHLELFANRKVIVVPAGIGASARGCRYPVRTDAPTGVVHVAAADRYRLGDVFRVWGRKLGASRLLSFRGRVAVFVDGRRFAGDPRRVVLTNHRQIVVEVGGYVAPHPRYLFPKGSE